MGVQIIRAAKSSCLFITKRRKLIRLYCPFDIIRKSDGKRFTVEEIIFEGNTIVYQTEAGINMKHAICEIQNI